MLGLTGFGYGSVPSQVSRDFGLARPLGLQTLQTLMPVRSRVWNRWLRWGGGGPLGVSWGSNGKFAIEPPELAYKYDCEYILRQLQLQELKLPTPFLAHEPPLRERKHPLSMQKVLRLGLKDTEVLNPVLPNL